MRPLIWLLSAYRSDSHAYWVDGLVRRHRNFDWQRFELPGRHFAWRIRSNPLSWLDRMERRLHGSSPDLIVATSMVDLATLKGLLPQIAGVPSLLYFHENQLAYPVIPGQVQSIEPCMVQIYAALAADRLAFNSDFNRDSFMDGIDRLARRLPDGMPENLSQRLRPKSEVLPVAVERVCPDRRGASAGPRTEAPLILWNHRWEHDKRPDRFARAMVELDQEGLAFRLALLGPRGRTPHPAHEELCQALDHRIAVDGYLPRRDYEDWLRRADWVVSTAEHEFQGISLIEAVSAGASPIVPDRLCYPEQYPESCRYDPASDRALLQALRSALKNEERRAPAIDDWLAPALVERWAELLLSSLQGSNSD